MVTRPKDALLLLLRLLLLPPFAAVVFGGAAVAQSPPTVGNLQMPLVSPAQAAQFFAARTAPPSDVPAMAPAALAQPPQSVKVDPVLGHELPADAVSAAGFPRADFAIRKPESEIRKNPAADLVVLGARAPSGTAIQRQPPVIGKP